MPFYLGTNVVSGDPGQAQWINTSTLPSGAKYNVWNAAFPSLAPAIPGNDLTQQAFGSSLVIPAGTVALGDTINWRFGITVDGGAGGGSFRWGLSIGGAQFLSGVNTILGGSTATLFPPNGLIGVFRSILNPADLLISGTVELPSGPDTSINLIQGVNIAGPVTVEVLWEWQAGTDAAASATLFTLGFQVDGEVP